MKALRPATLILAGLALFAISGCAKPAKDAAAAAPAAQASAETAAAASAAASGNTSSGNTSSGNTSSGNTASGNAAPAAAVAAAPRPWYADRLEKLGFYVFPAPVDVGDFTVEALKGGTASLSQAKGKIVLLNFWATWCPPCRAEMPSIEKLWDKRKNKDFTIIAVSVGEQKDTVSKFIAENKYSYPVYLDPSSQLGSAFNASSIPTTYILDKTGKVIAGTQGSREYDSDEVLAAFDELMAR